MAVNNVSVILVHGGWADGSSWARVIVGLSARGISAVAAPIPLTDLADDVAALERVIARAPGPVILVSHAYSGAVIGLARAARVKALVYINSFAPDDGEKLTDLFFRAAPHPLAPKLAPDSDNLLWLPDDAFASAFAPNASKDELLVLSAAQRPLRFSCMTTATTGSVQWKTVPTWYLVAEEDRMIVADTQHFMAKRINAKTKTYSVDHAPLVTAPELVIDIIQEAVLATAA